MANVKAITRYAILSAWVLMGSCGHELDYSGAITSEYDANQRFAQSQEWNNANAARTLNVSHDAYYLAFGGDCHVGGEENLSILLDSARIPNIEALILAGDNTTGHQDDYDALKELLYSKDSVIWYLTTGNHDLYHAGWPAFYSYFGPSSYTIKVNTPSASDLLIMLDNSSGTLGSLQMEWLKNVLMEQREFYRHCIVVCHVNFFRNRFTVSTNPAEEELYTLIDLFAEYNVEMLISGHDHERYIEVFGTTTYITMDAVKDGVENASWMKLHVGTDRIDYEFIDF